MRQAELLRLFNNQDEKSVDFSEDPEMYQKLDMKKPKRGEERPYDIEKIYRFQLEKDIAKIRESKGEYADRNELYMSLRHRDPNYHKVAAPTEVGVDGNFNDLIKYTKDESWKSTSKPYGEIAHKRYLEWLANLPKGPTEEELKDKAQRKQDQELWRQIVSGELELTKKDLKRAERDRINRLREEEDDKHKNEYLEEKRRRYQAIESEQFELLRKLPTKREFKASKKKWHKGIHYPYNFDKGFPVVMARKKDQLQPISNLEKPFVPRQFSSDVILNGYYDCEKQYGDYLAEINFKKAEKYIKNHYYTIEKERKKKEKQAEIDKMNRRRQGRLGVDILTDVAAAKYLTTKDKLAYTVKLDDDEDGEGQRSGGKSYEVSIGRKKQKKVIEFDQLEKIVSGEIKKQSKKESVYEKTSSDEEEEKEEEEKVGDDSDSSSEISEEEEEEDDGDKEEEEKDNLDDDDRQLGRISLQVASPRRGFFRSPSSIFPESLFFSSPSSSKKNKSKKNKKNSSYFQFTLPDFSKLDWDDVTFFYEDTKKSFKRSSFYKFITKSRRMTEPYKAPTTRRKEEALKDIIKLGEIISNPKYLETRLELSSNELTMEEFELLTKRKKKELKLHIKELTKRNPTKEEQHELLKYQKRYQLLEEMIQERYERYSKAEELINIIKILLEQKYNNIEKDIHEPVMEQYQRYWMNKCFYSPLIYKKMPKKLENLLPNPNEPEKVQEIVEALLSHRFSERIQMIKQRRIWYRISHFGFANVDAFDDKIKRQRRNHTPDDLLLAVQSGDYRHVIDILDPARDSIEDKFNQDELGVKIDDISSDGLTAMYACLSMILNKEVLDTDANLDDLLLTNWQRRKKRFFSLFQSKTKALLSTARFDYVLLILIYYGGNLNFPRVEFGKDGLTILHLACQQGALEMIQWLLQKGVDINQLSALQYRTPLMFAVERDQLETMLLLLREGAILGIHHIDNNGNNVLHYAALYARPLITQILLICGVKSNIRNKKGYLPAEEAKMSGRLEIATTILTFKDDVIDHMQRIDYLVSRIDVPFDYHTGKSYDLNNVSNPEIPDVTPPPADSTVHRTRHHHPGGGSETAIREEDEEEDDNDNEEEGDVFPVESPSLALVIDPSSRKTDPSAVSSTSEEATPNTRRINKIWNAIQRPLRTAYSSPDMTVQEHLKKVKEDHSKSAPSLLPRIDLPLSAIGRVSSVIDPKLVGDGMKKKEKAEVKNADEIIVAPKLRRTILQLNYSRKANVKSPQS